MDNLCLKCADPIVNKRKDAIYCSSRCQDQARQKRYRDKDPKRSNKSWIDYSLTDKGTVTLLLNYAKGRARRQNVPFNLSREFITKKWEARVCEFSGLPLVRARPGNYKVHPFAPSLDKVIPKLGYIESNVRMVAFIVNGAKSDYTDELLIQMCKAISDKHITG